MTKKNKNPMLPNLNSISIKNFRGISDERVLEFDKNHNIIILVGENGNGKSSFVNALEYLFKGELEFLNQPGLNKTEPIVHEGCDEEDLLIELKYGGNNYFRKTFDDFDCTKFMKKFLFNSVVENASFILNRSKILDFVNASETERYNKFMELYISSDFDKTAKVFSTANYHYKSTEPLHIKKKQEELSSEINSILGSYVNIENDNKNFENLIENTNLFLSFANKDPISETMDLEEYLEKIDYSEDDIIVKNLFKEFNEYYKKINFQLISSELNGLLNDYESLSNESNKVLRIQYAILNNSEEYFKNGDMGNCPICGSEIDETILGVIDSKLSSLEKALSNLNQWDKSYNSFKSNLNYLKTNLEKIMDLCSKLIVYNENFEEFSLSFKEILDEIDCLIEDLEKLNEFETSILDFGAKYDFNRFSKIIDEFKNYFTNYINEIDGNPDLIKDIKKTIIKLNDYKKYDDEKELLDKKNNFSKKILDTFNDCKIAYVDNIIEDIWKLTEEYYDFIHKDDLINSPKINLKKNSRISLYLNAFGHEGDSRNYASEGHLDSLGICIYLAFMSKFNNLKLLVLDDILTTVDLSHKNKIARLIIDKFKDFNILITTHNALWADQLSRIAKNTSGVDAKVLEIYDWNLLDGPMIRQNEKFDDKINHYLQDYDYNAAGNTARRYLENILFDYTRKYKVKAEIKERHTVHDYFKPVKDKSLQVVGKDEGIKDYLNYVWDELDMSSFVGNLLSHHNTDSYFLYSSDIIPFCYMVGELNKVLNCHNCEYNENFVFDKETKEMKCCDECKFKNNIFKTKNDLKKSDELF